MDQTFSYSVLGVSSDRCRAAIAAEVSAVSGVTSVDVNLEDKRVIVRGDYLDDTVLRAAIKDAGYDAV